MIDKVRTQQTYYMCLLSFFFDKIVWVGYNETNLFIMQCLPKGDMRTDSEKGMVIKMFLDSFELPDIGFEENFLFGDIKMLRTYYNSTYPFKIFPQKKLSEIRFEPVTFFYGGNGSGKTTLLNVIAESLSIKRGTYFNRSDFFQDYVEHCEYWTARYSKGIPENSRIITSDDVFDYLLDIRCMNEKVDKKRKELLEEYASEKYSSFQMKSIEDLEKLRCHNDARKLTGSKYVKSKVMSNLPEKSNGESAFIYFTEHIKENALYLLDEPENSLAPELQQQLVRFIEDSVRFYNCQFIIATHSPFLLSMKDSVVYDLDMEPVCRRKWTELKNVRIYYDFFSKNREEFEK